MGGRRTRTAGRTAALALAVVATVLVGCDPTPPTTFTVTSGGTAADAAPGDGTCAASGGGCTLRAAIQEANATPRVDIVQIAAGVTPALGGAVPITAGLELRGGGATLRERLVHAGGDLTVRDLEITGVAAPSGCGGAIASTGAKVVLDRVVIRGNSTAGNHGGGVCTAGPTTILDSLITANEVRGTAASSGGGVRTTSSLGLVRTTVAGNEVAGRTGFVPHRSQVSVAGAGPVSVLLSTLGGSDTRGDRSLVAPTAQGTVVASTLGRVGVSPALTVRGSIVLGCDGTAPTRGGHLATGTDCGPAGPTDVSIDGGLERLMAQGGPAPVRLPRAGSAIVDAIPAGTPGLCDATLPGDQRGRARPAGGACDIGAAELHATLTAGAPVRYRPTPNGAFQGRAVVAVAADGTVVGNVLGLFGGSLGTTATRWSSSTTDPAPLSAQWSRATDVHDSGYVVGSVSTSSTEDVPRATAWDPSGVAVDLGTLPGDATSVAVAVDDAGRVVGTSTGPGGTRAWWRAPTGGPLVALPSLGRTTARVIDDDGAGLVLGHLTGASAPTYVVWDLDAGTATPIAVPALPGGGPVQDLSAIDRRGTVYGTVARPDLGDGCSAEWFFPCEVVQAIRITPATGAVDLLPAPLPIMRPVEVDATGRVLLEGASAGPECGFCDNLSHRLYVLDPATGETVDLDDVDDVRDIVGADLHDEGLVLGHSTQIIGPASTLTHPEVITLAG